MGEHLDRSAMTALQNIAGNSAQGYITSGSYEFDEDTMRTLITEWLELGDDYNQSYIRSDDMIRVEGPGLDFASESHAAAANASGDAYRRYLQSNRDYCYAQAQLFLNTLHDYLGIEHANVTEYGAADKAPDNDSRAGF